MRDDLVKHAIVNKLDKVDIERMFHHMEEYRPKQHSYSYFWYTYFGHTYIFLECGHLFRTEMRKYFSAFNCDSLEFSFPK